MEDGDYNPDQLRPVDEGADARDRKQKTTGVLQ